MLVTIASWFMISFVCLFLLHMVLVKLLVKWFVKLTHAQCYIISTKIISGVQATVVSCISLRTLVICTDIMHDRDPVLEMYIYPLSAYFIYDLVVMYLGFRQKLLDGIDDRKSVQRSLKLFLEKELFMVLHHLILECVGLPVVLVLRRGLGIFFIAGFILAELSTPFYNIRGILTTIGIRSGRLYTCNALAFVLSFFVARVAMVPYLYYRYSTYAGITLWSVPFNIPIKCVVGSLSFMWLQCYWFSLIVRHIFMVLSRTYVKVDLHDENGARNLAGKDK